MTPQRTEARASESSLRGPDERAADIAEQLRAWGFAVGEREEALFGLVLRAHARDVRNSDRRKLSSERRALSAPAPEAPVSVEKAWFCDEHDLDRDTCPFCNPYPDIPGGAPDGDWLR